MSSPAVFIFRVLSRLPLPVLHNLGALFGWLAWWLSPSYRKHFQSFIEQAGLAAHRRAAIVEAGKGMLELPRIWMREQADILDLVAKVSGSEHVEAARAAGKGILFLTPHMGCFEIVAQYLAVGGPITVLYRKPRASWLQPLMEQGRGRYLKLAPADLSGVRRLIKGLRAGEAVGMLPDQVPGNGEGIWAPFFGRPAYTMTLAARLADTGAAVVMVRAERLAYGAGFHLHFSLPQEPPEADLVARTAQLNREIESLVRACPSQYLWGYNRYKRPKGVPPPC